MATTQFNAAGFNVTYPGLFSEGLTATPTGFTADGAANNAFNGNGN